jgi:hypothetical protein
MFRMFHPMAEPYFADPLGQEDPDRALEQPLKVDHQVIASVSQKTDESHALSDCANQVSGSQVGEPLLTVGDKNTVQCGMVGEEIGRRFFHQPGDVSIRIVGAQRPERGERMDYISNRAGFHDKNVHRSDQSASERASTGNGVIDECRQVSTALHFYIQRADLLAGDELFPVISERVLPQGLQPQRGIDHLVHAGFVDSLGDTRG